jgi:hypothetical protein
MESLQLKEVLDKKTFRDFIYLPEKIHSNYANWMPPIYMDDKAYFNPKKNLSFRGCDYRQVVAYRNGKPVGRIMGIINHQHNQMMSVQNARFGFFDAFEDQEVAHALISDIEQWGKAKGMNKIIGPFGFSDRDIQGCLIEGFEYEPVVDSAVNPPYIPELIKAEGYEKEVDCVIYRFPLSIQLPEVYDKILQRVTSRKDFKFMEFTSRKQLKPIILPALRMTNEAFSQIYGFVPMDEKEMMELAKRYLPILDPKFLKVVMKGDEVVAYLISMPNLYKGIQKARGRVLPFGFIHILRAMKNAKSINTMLGAVAPAYQKQGLDVFLSMSTLATARAAGMTSVDTHVVLEENDDMMAELKRYGAHLIKKFRVYQKKL